MKKLTLIISFVIVNFLLLIGCSDKGRIMGTKADQNNDTGASLPLNATIASNPHRPADTPGAGATTVNGWYEGDEIYYIDQGVEEGVSERGNNQIYLIGGNRLYQAQVVLFIPGEVGYTPHWNVNIVHTAAGKTLADILASAYVSALFPEALFDDVEDILGAQSAGLVTIVHPGVVVNCPIISEQGADAPGNTQASEDFPPFPNTF